MFREKAEDENIEGRRIERSPRREERREGVRERVPELPAPRELEDVVIAPAAEESKIQNLELVLKASAEPQRLKRVYPTTCDRCGRATEIPFEPTPGKPKYCKDCLAIIRAERRRQAPAPLEGIGRSARVPPPSPRRSSPREQ